MAQDILIKITDRDGILHEVQAPTDMNMNVMELVRAYELAPEGTIGICGGMAMCASCQCYVVNEVALPEMSVISPPSEFKKGLISSKAFSTFNVNSSVVIIFIYFPHPSLLHTSDSELAKQRRKRKAELFFIYC